MKKWFLTIWSLVFCCSVFAQQEERILPLEYYKSTNYNAAIQNLLKLENKGQGDFETKIILAESYYAQRDFKAALEWLQKASDINDLSDKYQLLLADLHRTAGNYTVADSIYQRLGKHQNKLSAKLKSVPPSSYEVLAVPMLNTPGDEFSPGYYRDGIVFTGNAKRKKNVFSWNNRPWLKVYYLPYQPKGEEKGTPSEMKLPEVNKFHGGPVSFTRQDKMIYFSHTQNHGKKSKSPVATLGIFSANRKNDKWTDLKPLVLNHAEYSISHPTLSADGGEMYFVSDMPGGYGGTDIYYTKFRNGKWSVPENLGAVINTSANEMFPFLHKDETLYFASEGHAGYGGLDIFYSKYTNGVWSAPVNMGKPVNSGYDDFGLILDKNKQNGYFSSNRPGGAGNDDVYRVVSKEQAPVKQTKTVAGKVTDLETLDPIKDALITVFYKGEQRTQVSTDESGNYEVSFSEDEEHIQIIASANGYFPHDAGIDIEKSKQEIQYNIQLQKIEINKSIVVPNIYYELDKADITPSAELELKKLYRLLMENPTWIIEISAHTDVRADAAYNQKLSEKRAENVVAYLIKNGMAKSRLYAKGYGESRILNHCKEGVKCSEEEHALNRRTEFKLVGFEQAIENSSNKTVILFAEEYSGKNELIYKIQIGVFKEPNQKWLQQLSDLGNIEKVPVEGKDLYRIFIAPYPTYESAHLFMEKVHQRGLKDAFIVPFYKGKPVSLDEAKKIKKEK